MLEVPLLPSYWSGARNSCYHSWPIQKECLWSHFFLLIGQEPATSVTTVVRIRVRKFRVFCHIWISICTFGSSIYLNVQKISSRSWHLFTSAVDITSDDHLRESSTCFMSLIFVSCWFYFCWSSERISPVFMTLIICQLLTLFLLIIWENLPCDYDTYNLNLRPELGNIFLCLQFTRFLEDVRLTVIYI